MSANRSVGRRAVDSSRGCLAAWSGATAGLFLCACASVPITGRTAFNVIPVSEDPALGAQAYSEVMAQSTLADDHPQAAMVHRVVDRLSAEGQKLVEVPFDWEVHIIEEGQTVNAWCMPGGRMAVYTGILPVTGDETGLAVVMGHEIGHAIARHGTERMTQQMGAQAVIAYIAGDYVELAGTATNLLVLMPFGRSHELEADHIGLILMARAGYDPREAVDFWKRMAASSGGAPPEFLSTHPSPETRIRDLQKRIPQNLPIAEQAHAQGRNPRCR